MVGGVPEVAKLLLESYLQAGYETNLITSTPDSKCREKNIIRLPSFMRLISEYRRSNVVIMMGPTFKLGWPLILTRKKFLISHQAGNNFGFMQKILIKKGVNVACSRYLASKVSEKCLSYPNPYNNKLFSYSGYQNIKKDKDFIYVGRLVEDKGVDVLIRAMSQLNLLEHEYKLTIVGCGSDEIRLRNLVSELKLEEKIAFIGVLQGANLAEMISRHRVGVIPSRWQEPFGIVALEYAAMGLFVVGSNVGGLPEAIGPSGVTFLNEDHEQLAYKMLEAIVGEAANQSSSVLIERHLEKSAPEVVAKKYIEILLNTSL